MAPASTPPRLPRHERPGFINDGSVLAAVNTASRRLWRWPPASVDRHCARRLPEAQAGTEKRRSAEQRNCSQPAAARKEKHSTVFGQDRHQPSRSGVPAGTMDWVRPQCLQEVLGLKPRQPRASKIGPALSSSNTIRRQPSADPVQKHDPGSGYGAKKGLTSRGPLQKQTLSGGAPKSGAAAFFCSSKRKRLRRSSFLRRTSLADLANFPQFQMLIQLTLELLRK